MTKNNSKNWIEIEEEFILFWGLAPKGSLKYNKGKDILGFFKPYFQEILHDKVVDELERSFYSKSPASLVKEGLK